MSAYTKYQVLTKETLWLTVISLSSSVRFKRLEPIGEKISVACYNVFHCLEPAFKSGDLPKRLVLIVSFLPYLNILAASEA